MVIVEMIAGAIRRFCDSRWFTTAVILSSLYWIARAWH